MNGECMSCIIVSEQLNHVHFYWNKAMAENILKVILHFYSSNDISVAKRDTVKYAAAALLMFECAGEQHSSTQWSASEAEADDISWLLDVLRLVVPSMC